MKMQWTFPETFGEDKFLVLVEGLHIEMALWATVGNLERGSRWLVALTEYGVTKIKAAAISFLKETSPV